MPVDRLAHLDPYLRDCLNINPEDITAEYIRIPADLAYWNYQYSLALREALEAKHALDVLGAQLEPMVRAAIREAGGKPTEGGVEAAIESNKDHIAARERVTEAETQKSRMYGNLDAVRTKKEMLISLGAHLRIEMENDPVIRDRMGTNRRG